MPLGEARLVCVGLSPYQKHSLLPLLHTGPHLSALHGQSARTGSSPQGAAGRATGLCLCPPAVPRAALLPKDLATMPKGTQALQGPESLEIGICLSSVFQTLETIL